MRTGGLPLGRGRRLDQSRGLRRLRPVLRHGRPQPHHAHRHRRAGARPYLLASVAAVVLGGVVLGGGIGGLLGPIIAVFILRIIRTILTLAAVDPNVTTIVEGTIMVAVVMFGAFLVMRRKGHERERSCIPPKRPCPHPRAHRAIPGRQSGHPADHPFAGSRRRAGNHAPRHHLALLVRQHDQIRHSIGDARCLPNADHADRWHRSVGAVVATVSAFVVASITPLYGPFAGVWWRWARRFWSASSTALGLASRASTR
jgi:hypothetical protein